MCSKKRLQRYYEKKSSESFDKRAINTYETFEAAKGKLEEVGEEIGLNMLNSIQNTADKYLQSVSVYDVTKLNMMSAGERDLAFREWSQARRLTHNSLISKLNMGTRYFLKGDLGNIANLPKVTQETRDIAGDFANELILGAYLKTK